MPMFVELCSNSTKYLIFYLTLGRLQKTRSRNERTNGRQEGRKEYRINLQKLKVPRTSPPILVRVPTVSKLNVATKYSLEYGSCSKKILRKGTRKKKTSETEEWEFRLVNITRNIHTQRTPFEYRATIHCATRITLASLPFGCYSCLLCTRWKALDEIYQIYMRLHLSTVTVTSKIQQVFVTNFD